MKTQEVVFKDNYGVLALVASPEVRDKACEWWGTNLKLELSEFFKNLPKKKKKPRHKQERTQEMCK